MTKLNMLNNFCFMKYTLKSVPGLADVGVPHGDRDGPRTPSRCLKWSGNKIKSLFKLIETTFPKGSVLKN